MRQYACDNGATSLVIESGPVVNEKLAALLLRVSMEGKTFHGGKVRLVRKLPDLITGEPNIPIFEIDFPAP
jgi:hypothetical protein